MIIPSNTPLPIRLPHLLFPVSLCVLAFWAFFAGSAFANADHTSRIAPENRIAHPTPALRSVSLFVQWYPQTQFAGFIMAREKGFFQQNGLDIKFIWAKLGDKPLEALAHGEVDFASGWLASALTMRAHGHKLVNILQLHQRSASVVVARTDILTPGYLSGQILLSWGGDFKIELDLFLRRNRISPAKILPQSSSMAPFVNGLVGGAQAMEYNELHWLKDRGMQEKDMHVFRLADYGVNFIGDGLYATEDFIKSNPETVAAMRRAVLRGWEYAMTHEDETVTTVIKYAESKNLRVTSTHQRYMLRVTSQLITAQGWDDPTSRGQLCKKNFEDAKALLIEADYPLHDLTLEQFHAPQ